MFDICRSMHNKRQTCELDYVNQSFSYTHDIIIQDNTYKNVDSRITSFCYANFCGKWKYFVLFTHDWIHGEMVCRINATKSDYTVDLLSLCSIYWKKANLYVIRNSVLLSVAIFIPHLTSNFVCRGGYHEIEDISYNMKKFGHKCRHI